MLRPKTVLGSVVCLFTAALVSQTLCQTQGPAQPRGRPDPRQSQQLFQEQRKKDFEKRVAENKERQDRWMADRQKEFKDRANGKDERRNELIRQTLELTEEQWKVIEPKINKVYFLGDQAGIKIEFSGGGGGYGGGGTGISGTSPAGRTLSTGTGADSGRKAQSSGGGSASSGAGPGSGTSANPAGGTTSTRAGKDGWQTVQSSTSSSAISGGGGSGSAGSGGGQVWSGPLWRLADRELTEGERTCEELQKLLDDKNSKQEDIDQKIEALRRARENAAKELTKARQELREVLTARQQARLVLTGLLD